MNNTSLEVINQHLRTLYATDRNTIFNHIYNGIQFDEFVGGTMVSSRYSLMNGTIVSSCIIVDGGRVIYANNGTIQDHVSSVLKEGCYFIESCLTGL